jgi:protein phosphatase
VKPETHPHPDTLLPVTLHWSGSTDRGKVRKNNEDAFLGLRFDAQDVQRLGKVGSASNSHHDYAFAVSDGMGGAHAGEFASNIAVEKITTLLPRSYKLSALGLSAGIDDILGELFDQIHRALVYVGNAYEECHGMETTLTLAWFAPGWMYFAHVGDSRLYHLTAAGLKQLTHDDTHVGWLLRNGHIKEWEARIHPRRTVLQKSLGGTNQFVDPQVGAVAYEPGDVFFLCTDGLTEGLFNGTLEDMLRANVSAEELVKEAVDRNGKDNTTALVVRVG